MTTDIIISRESIMTAEGKHVNGCSKPVFCMNTGKVWPSVTDAAKAIGVAPNNLSTAIHKGSKCHGHVYKFMSESESCIPAMLARIQALSEMETKAKAYDEAIATLEKQRKAEEKKQADIAKAKEKLAKRREIAARIEERLKVAYTRINEAELELQTLEGKGDVA